MAPYELLSLTLHSNNRIVKSVHETYIQQVGFAIEQCTVSVSRRQHVPDTRRSEKSVTNNLTTCYCTKACIYKLFDPVLDTTLALI